MKAAKARPQRCRRLRPVHRARCRCASPDASALTNVFDSLRAVVLAGVAAFYTRHRYGRGFSRCSRLPSWRSRRAWRPRNSIIAVGGGELVPVARWSCDSGCCCSAAVTRGVSEMPLSTARARLQKRWTSVRRPPCPRMANHSIGPGRHRIAVAPPALEVDPPRRSMPAAPALSATYTARQTNSPPANRL